MWILCLVSLDFVWIFRLAHGCVLLYGETNPRAQFGICNVSLYLSTLSSLFISSLLHPLLSLFLFFCKGVKLRKMGASALCTVDDASCFRMIRLGPKTSVYELNATVSAVTSCDVTNRATTLDGFNKARLLASRGCVRFARRPSLQ